MTIRYKIKPRLFRKPLIVVQIHETRNHSACGPSTGGFLEEWQSQHWRDATAEDLLAKTPEGVVIV
jgi:hypothetical protein